MKRNSNLWVFLCDISFALILLFASYYVNYIRILLGITGLSIINPINYFPVQIILCFMGVIYLITTLTFKNKQQFTIAKLVKFFTILLGFFLVVIYLLFSNVHSKNHSINLYLSMISIIIMIIAVKTSLLIINNKISHSKNKIIIKGDYGQTIPFNTIENISIEKKLPEIIYRIKGVDFMNIKKGKFKLSDGKECFIYISLSNPFPILKIERYSDLSVFLNCKTSQQTLELFAKYTVYKQMETSQKEKT